MKTITKYAKENRKKFTKAENALRLLLLGKHKFRTQRMIDFYIVDFLILDKKLILEVDGSSHDGKEAYDLRRDNYLISKGYVVKHFKNEAVFETPQLILNFIKSLPDVPRPPKERWTELYGKAAY